MTFLTEEDFHHLNYATPPKWKSAVDAALDIIESERAKYPLGSSVSAARMRPWKNYAQAQNCLACFAPDPVPEPPKEIEVTGEMFNAGWYAQIGRSVGHSLGDIYRAMAAVDPSRK